MRFTIAAVAVAAGLVQADSAGAALQHRYSFNDGTAKDSVGTAHGQLVNGAAIVNGVLTFDPVTNDGQNVNTATGQYVDLPNGLAKTRAFSLEAWFTYRGGANWQRVIDFGTGTIGEIPPTDKTSVNYEGRGFLIISPENGAGNMFGQMSIASHGDPNDTDFIYTSSPLPRNQELHVVYVHDTDAGVERLYLNGASVGTPGQTPGARFDPSTAEYTNFWLGRSQFYRDPFFNGTINEFRIWDNALSPADVQADFVGGPNAVPEPSFALPALVLAAIARRRPRSE